jgi:hypothetical protein
MKPPRARRDISLCHWRRALALCVPAAIRRPPRGPQRSQIGFGFRAGAVHREYPQRSALRSATRPRLSLNSRAVISSGSRGCRRSHCSRVCVRCATMKRLPLCEGHPGSSLTPRLPCRGRLSEAGRSSQFTNSAPRNNRPLGQTTVFLSCHAETSTARLRTPGERPESEIESSTKNSRRS